MLSRFIRWILPITTVALGGAILAPAVSARTLKPRLATVAQAQGAITQAEARGQGSIDALVAQNSNVSSASPFSQALQARYNNDPMVQQAIIKNGHVTSSDGPLPGVAPPANSPPPTPSPQSQAATFGDPCESALTDYPGGNHSRTTWSDAGVAYAWVQTAITDDWCFNYTAVLGVYYWSFMRWQGNGVCMTNNSWTNGPDGSWVYTAGGWHTTWAHAGHWATFGFGPAYNICAFTSSGHAVLRVANNGYWDWYDDYGY